LFGISEIGFESSVITGFLKKESQHNRCFIQSFGKITKDMNDLTKNMVETTRYEII